jgi:DNA-binding MarR family transcriptional regulator
VPQDFADRHVERWRDHWIDIPFEDDVEMMTVRVASLSKAFHRATERAVQQVDLQGVEYQTLHQLMIRDTPGLASPGALARELDVSAAGMTARLDGLEKRGLVKRMPGSDDRRRVDVEVTKRGTEVWRRAMALRGDYEDDLATALTEKELATLNRLLKKLTLKAESDGTRPY